MTDHPERDKVEEITAQRLATKFELCLRRTAANESDHETAALLSRVADEFAKLMRSEEGANAGR